MSPRSTLQVFLFLVLGFQLSLGLAKPTLFMQQVEKRAPTTTTQYQTNAERLAAGLPPLTPKRRFNPTRAVVAARDVPSPTPIGGSIRIRDSATNQDAGWISKTLSGGRIRMTPGAGDKLVVGFTYYAPSTVFELRISDNELYPFLGSNGISLRPTLPNVNNLVRTNSVPLGSTPSVPGSSGVGLTESHIWKFDPTTRELTGIWVNPDSSEVSTYFYLSTGPGDRFITASANPSLSTGVQQVRLFLDV